MPDNILSCRPGSYGRYAETTFAHLQSIGVKYVEIPVPALVDVGEKLRELESFGLQAMTTQCSFDVKDADGAAAFQDQLDATVQLGCQRIFVSVKRDELPEDIAYGRLRELGARAAEAGVTILLETHPDLITNGDVALATMRGVDHPNIRVNFDTANVYYYNEGVDGLAEMAKVIEFIGAVHLKDTNGGFKTWCFPALGEGIVDFGEVFRLCNDNGLTGPFTMEIEGIQGEELTLEETQDRVARSVQHLRDLGCVS